MANGFEHLMNTPQTAIGKGMVGEPPAAPAGKEGVIFKLSLFFDGTLNNRSNTNKRRGQPGILSLKGDESSYGNFYSNVAILEYLNLRNKPERHEVSVYVEGIGTVDFSNELKAQGVADKDNGNDDRQGYAFGSGATGITGKVTKGINDAKRRIKEAYKVRDQYVKEIIIDVFGFSRGAAAARHFVSRHHALRGPWPNQGPPKLTVNFVGLFDTVSSYEDGGSNLLGVLGNGAQGKIEGIFDDDVKQLGLNLGGTPRKVVHLAAGDEIRENFSLTTIDSSLDVGKGIELTMPGAHSDVGGGYAEYAHEEVRRIRSETEKRHLIAEGWYRPDQFRPAYAASTPSIPGKKITIGEWGIPVFPSISSYTMSVWENGIRTLTNRYQYVALALMLDLARRHGRNQAAEFTEPAGRFATYQVPTSLRELCANFLAQAKNKEGKGRGTIVCPPNQLHSLRNHYLHRSHRSTSEAKIGMGPAPNDKRVLIDDRLLVDKFSVRAKQKVNEAPQRVKGAVGDAMRRAGRAWSGVRQ